jgi:hypothetical protein
MVPIQSGFWDLCVIVLEGEKGAKERVSVVQLYSSTQGVLTGGKLKIGLMAFLQDSLL